MSRILVIAAHPDDELLGLGGTIRKKVDNGDTAYALILGEGMTSRKISRSEMDNKEIQALHAHSDAASKIIGFSHVVNENIPDNRFDSIDMLDIVKIIEKYISEYKPDIVYTHHIGDRNIDHRITHEATLTACRPVGNYTVKEIYTFETPSSTEWGFSNGGGMFFPNVFEDITETLQSKLDAMKCYETELRDYPHPRSIEALKIIAARWGTVIGCEYAEAFILIRSCRI